MRSRTPGEQIANLIDLIIARGGGEVSEPGLRRDVAAHVEVLRHPRGGERGGGYGRLKNTCEPPVAARFPSTATVTPRSPRPDRPGPPIGSRRRRSASCGVA